MSLAALIGIGFVVALGAGWAIGQMVTATAVTRWHIPLFGMRKLMPLVAALALAGGYSVGAWQATETLNPDPEILSGVEACASQTSCTPCGGCSK